MNLREQLRMAQVKRYPICHTHRDQSVAEHSFGVMLITMELCSHVKDREMIDCALAYAMTHDQDEVHTGDIPSPFKRELRSKCPAVVKHLDPQVHSVPVAVKGIVKLADYLEAIHFLKEYGGSRFSNEVLEDIYHNFNKALDDLFPVVPPEVLRSARAWGQII